MYMHHICTRRYLARCVGLKLAQGFILKLFDPTVPNDPYYWSKATGRAAWTKPWVFGHGGGDATKEVWIPPKGSEYVILCTNCAGPRAERACDDCGDAFCEPCFKTLHSKGNRVGHSSRVVPGCFECGFQSATRFCRVCQRIGEDRVRIMSEKKVTARTMGGATCNDHNPNKSLSLLSCSCIETPL